MTRHTGRAGASLVALACFLFAAVPLALALDDGSVPRVAPDLALKTVGGPTVELASLKGKVVAVLWISTNCPHCQDTCEELAPIYEKYAGQGFEIMAMAVNQNAPGGIGRFKADHGVEFPIGVSTRSDWMRFADMSVMARAYVPFLMLVDRDGRIRYEHRGRDGEFWSDMETNLVRELEILLAEAPGARR